MCRAPWYARREPARGADPRRDRMDAVIMTVLCLIIAAKLIGDGISGQAA
jgi:hypothetical protein